MATLMEAFPKEIARVRVVLDQYRAMGPSGQFGAMMTARALRTADRAVISGDMISMVDAYQELQDVTAMWLPT